MTRSMLLLRLHFLINRGFISVHFCCQITARFKPVVIRLTILQKTILSYQQALTWIQKASLN